MEEIWKDVVGYEGLYQVSNMGNVKSLNWRGLGVEKNLYLKKHNKGYLKVELASDGKRKSYTVHMLVAIAFIPNPLCYSQINHIDENKANNCVSNLEWCTPSENNLKYHKNHPNQKRKGKRKGNRVQQISLDGELIREWDNARQVFTETWMSDWSISECCRGNRKTAYGYKWQYAS